MTDSQLSRFTIYQGVSNIRLKDKLNNTWYQFDTQEEVDAKIKELEDEQQKKSL